MELLDGSSSGDTYVLIILASTSSTSSPDDFRDGQAYLSSRLDLGCRSGRDCFASQVENRASDDEASTHYVTTARAVSLAIPFCLPIISVPRIEITKRAPRSVSRASGARARARSLSTRRTRRYTRWERRRGGPVEQGPPVHQRSL